MPERKQAEHIQPGALIMPYSDLLRVLAAGAIVGLITLALYALLERYVVTPALCGGAGVGNLRCDVAPQLSSGIAVVFGAIAALFYFVQQRVYRPLLVIILVSAALWGVPIMIAALPIWLALLMAAILFSLGYGAFAWLVQLRNFVQAVVASVLLAVVIRLIISP